MSRLFVVGITGQSGAGKSTFVDYLKKNGIKCIDADLCARKVVEKGKPCLEKLIENYGKAIINSNGTLNRAALADIAFSSNIETEKLNKLMHPYILDEIRNIIDKYAINGEEYVILDAPQLFEANADKMCNYTLAVLANDKTKIERIMQRDKISEDAAKKRIAAALNNSFFEKNCNFVFYNDGTTAELYCFADSFLKKIKGGDLLN